jgi:hypothetical protein
MRLHSRAFRLIAGSAALSFLVIVSATYAEKIGTIKEPLAVQRKTVWASPMIPVCWENPSDPAAQGWVRAAVARTWEAESAVRFTGWGTCTSTSKGIRIQIADVNPATKGLGNKLDGLANGMVLDFTFATWGTSCQTKRQYCIETIAVHEFGHALGIAHEQNRSDALDCGIAHQGSDPDLTITPYDLKSVMNYCNPKWDGDGKLSDSDKFGVNVLYGKGPTPVPGGSPTVASYKVPGSEQLETMFVDNSGKLGLVWKANNSFWKGPVGLSNPGLLPKDARIAMVAYPPNNQLEAFYAGTDGAIYVTWKANNDVWSQPTRLTAPNLTRPGADITAVYYPPDNHLEVQFIDNSGKLNLLWKVQNGKWFAPIGISGPIAPAGGGISAAFYPPGNLEVVFAGNDGAIYVAWKVNNGKWNNPVGIAPAKAAPPGAAMTMMYYPPNQQLEAFFVDPRGAVSVIWKANNSAWNKPVGLTPAGTGVAGAPVVSAFYPLNNQLEVFTIGGSGAVTLLWKANNGAWNQPIGLSASGASRPGSHLGVQFQPMNNQLELFFTDAAGNLNLVWKAQNQKWSSALRL